MASSKRKPTRRYVSLTMTSKKRDERTGDLFRWTLVLSEDLAEETRRAWGRRGVSVTEGREVAQGAAFLGESAEDVPVGSRRVPRRPSKRSR
jgi:hypothetical protein